MPDTIVLSPAAVALLRLRLSGQRVGVTDETQEAYRELAVAGYAEPIHTPRGRNSHYRLTLAAMNLNLNGASPSPSP